MNIVILSFDLPEANVVTHRLLQRLGGNVSGILSSTSIVKGKNNVRAMIELGQMMGWRYGGAWQVHRWLAQLGAASLAVRRKPAGFGSLTALAREAGVPLVKTADAHTEASLSVLRTWAPDLIVSNYFNQVIRRPILDIPPRGIINMHPALLPRNRGLMPCFWAMAVGDASTGATVHWVDEGLDTGRVLLQDTIAIEPGETVLSLSQRCSECGAELLLRCIDELRGGALAGHEQAESERTYQSWPTRGGIRRLYRKGYRYGSVPEMWAQVGQPRARLSKP